MIYVCSEARFRGKEGPEGGGGERRGEMAGLAVFVRLIRQLDRGEDGKICGYSQASQKVEGCGGAEEKMGSRGAGGFGLEILI